MQFRSNPARGNPEIPVNHRLAAFRMDWTDNRWTEHGVLDEDADQQQVSLWFSYVGVPKELQSEFEFTDRVLTHMYDGLLMKYLED